MGQLCSTNSSYTLYIVGYVSSVGYVACMVRCPEAKLSLVTPLGGLNFCWTLHNVIKKFAILHELLHEDLTRALVPPSEMQ